MKKSKRMSTVLLSSIAQTANNNTNHIVYDSFIFVDNVTKQKVILGDAKNTYNAKVIAKRLRRTLDSEQTPRIFADGQNSFQIKRAQTINLKECISIMKTTKMFQMESLRKKIFKKQQAKQNVKNLQLRNNETKKLNDQIGEKIQQLTRKQLSDLLAHKIKHPRSKVMKLSKQMNRQINHQNSHNIQQIISELVNNCPERTKRRKTKITYQDVQIKGEKQITTQMMGYLHNKIKENGQYLIRPSLSDQLHKNLYHKSTKSAIVNNNDVQDKKNNQIQIDNLHFDKAKPNQNVMRLKAMIQIPHLKLTKKQRQAFLFTQEGLLFDLQMLIVSDPQIINLRDFKGNTLLHIAAKYNHAQIFQYIIKKQGLQALKNTNHFNKTPVDLARLFMANDTSQLGTKYLKTLEMY